MPVLRPSRNGRMLRPGGLRFGRRSFLHNCWSDWGHWGRSRKPSTSLIHIRVQPYFPIMSGFDFGRSVIRGVTQRALRHSTNNAMAKIKSWHSWKIGLDSDMGQGCWGLSRTASMTSIRPAVMEKWPASKHASTWTQHASISSWTQYRRSGRSALRGTRIGKDTRRENQSINRLTLRYPSAPTDKQTNTATKSQPVQRKTLKSTSSAGTSTHVQC
jgi:hypothetical protein